jgi:hypothetical protein
MSQALLNFSQRLLSDLTAPPIFGALHTRIDSWRVVANICVCYLLFGVFFYGVGWRTSGNSPDYRVLYEGQGEVGSTSSTVTTESCMKDSVRLVLQNLVCEEQGDVVFVSVEVGRMVLHDADVLEILAN